MTYWWAVPIPRRSFMTKALRGPRKSSQIDQQGETSCKGPHLWGDRSAQATLDLATRSALIGESLNGEKARYRVHGARGDRGGAHRASGHPGAVRFPADRGIQ